MEGCVLGGFKTPVITPLIKKANLQADGLKTMALYLYLVSYQNWLNAWFLSKLEHIHVHNLDNLFQSGYKAGHSTETALLCIKHEVHFLIKRRTYCLDTA